MHTLALHYLHLSNHRLSREVAKNRPKTPPERYPKSFTFTLERHPHIPSNLPKIPSENYHGSKRRSPRPFNTNPLLARLLLPLPQEIPILNHSVCACSNTLTAPLRAKPTTCTPRALFSSAQEETADLLKTIHHARTQLREVQRLYHLKAAGLDATETRWIEATMADLDDAVRAVALLVEPARVEQQTRRRGSIGLATQLRWVCRDSRRARLQRSRLLMCHQSLMVVFERLRGVQVPAGGAAHQQELEKEVMELPAGDVVRPESGGASVGGLAMETGREEGVGGESRGLEEEMLDLLRWRQSKGNAAAVSRAEEVTADGGSLRG